MPIPHRPDQTFSQGDTGFMTMCSRHGPTFYTFFNTEAAAREYAATLLSHEMGRVAIWAVRLDTLICSPELVDQKHIIRRS